MYNTLLKLTKLSEPLNFVEMLKHLFCWSLFYKLTE